MQYLNGLVNKLKGDPNDPLAAASVGGAINPKNTGVSGGMPVLGAPPVADAPDPAAVDRVKGQLAGVFGSMGPSTSGVPAAAPRTSATTLMEGDPGKLADPAHIAKSPKYQFLSEATQYGRGQEGDLLKDLQSKYGQFWNGVTFDGKGNFDVNNNDPAWDGVKHVDAYGGYNGGGDLKARWGVEDPNAPQGAPQGAGRPAFGGSTIAPMLQGDAQAGIQQALAGLGGGSDSGYLQKLIAQLQQGAQ